MGSRLQVLVLSTLAVALQVAAGASIAAERGCLEDPRNAAIAEAVGVWEVASDTGAEGLAEVRPILDGCAFELVRREADVEVARALIYLDPVADRWVERWVSRLGATARLEIEVVDDGLRLTGTMHDGEGGGTPVRLQVGRGQV